MQIIIAGLVQLKQNEHSAALRPIAPVLDEQLRLLDLYIHTNCTAGEGLNPTKYCSDRRPDSF